MDEDFPTLGLPCNEESCQGAGKYVCNAQGTDVECTVSSVGPTPEICDGIDNDCDGLIDEVDDNMPGVGVTCGTAVGECRQGISVCVTGHIVCNDVGPTPEICNGKDDDCDGNVDNDVVAPAADCNPPGLVSGAPLQGECRPGHFQCQGADGWVCVGGVGPSAEICDGKDNNCDGLIDNEADCGPTLICVNGQCVPRCRGNEQPCASNQYCQDGACLLMACKVNPCPDGQLCDNRGGCFDPCAGVTCPTGATCQRGLCQDCYSRGCLSGQICHNRQCEPDPCLAGCPAGQYCANGTCVRSCTGLVCPQGQSCRAGQCVGDACAGVVCPTGSYCDSSNPANVTCQNKICSGISCVGGTVCLESTGKCGNNPCEVVRCQVQENCIVQPDGRAECVAPSAPAVVTEPSIPAQVKPGSRGLFGCAVGGRGDGVKGEAGLLVLLGLLLARARRRRR